MAPKKKAPPADKPKEAKKDDAPATDAAPISTSNAAAPTNKEEVIAVRLYSGPAYQPINKFLRQVGQLSSLCSQRYCDIQLE